MLLLCSDSRNDVPPVPQRNVSIAAERGAVRPSNLAIKLCIYYKYSNLLDLFHIVCAHAYIGHVARYFSIIGETLQRWGKRILSH